MAVRKPSRRDPLDDAIGRLLALAARGVQPARMAREVEAIAGEWLRAEDADPSAVRATLDALREQLAAGVGDAEEQLADVDAGEPVAVRQAQATLAALVATRDAAQRALASIGG
jgi:hypothetical protein